LRASPPQSGQQNAPCTPPTGASPPTVHGQPLSKSCPSPPRKPLPHQTRTTMYPVHLLPRGVQLPVPAPGDDESSLRALPADPPTRAVVPRFRPQVGPGYSAGERPDHETGAPSEAGRHQPPNRGDNRRCSDQKEQQPQSGANDATSAHSHPRSAQPPPHHQNHSLTQHYRHEAPTAPTAVRDPPTGACAAPNGNRKAGLIVNSAKGQCAPTLGVPVPRQWYRVGLPCGSCLPGLVVMSAYRDGSASAASGLIVSSG